MDSSYVRNDTKRYKGAQSSKDRGIYIGPIGVKYRAEHTGWVAGGLRSFHYEVQETFKFVVRVLKTKYNLIG